jgi:hypothetical protein
MAGADALSSWTGNCERLEAARVTWPEVWSGRGQRGVTGSRLSGSQVERTAAA